MFSLCDFPFFCLNVSNFHLWFLIFYSFCSQLFPAATLTVRNKTQTSCYLFIFLPFSPLCRKKETIREKTKQKATSYVSLKQTPRRNGGSIWWIQKAGNVSVFVRPVGGSVDAYKSVRSCTSVNPHHTCVPSVKW